MTVLSPAFSALEQGLAELGCEALLVVAESSRDPDLASLVGSVHLGRSLAVVAPPATPRLAFLTPMERGEAALTGLDLLDPEALDAATAFREGPDPGAILATLVGRALKASGVAPGRLALAGSGPAGNLRAACGRLEKEGWVPVAGNELMLRFRKAKSAAQLAGIRRTAAGTCAAFFRLAELLAAAGEAGDAGGRSRELRLEGEPLRVGRLRKEVAVTLARFGLDQPEGNLIAPAEEGAVCHNTGTDRRALKAGESLVVDLFPRGELFADCTRTFCVGEAPEALRRSHETVARALAAAHRSLAAGRRGWDLQEETCELFVAAGYATPISDPGTVTGYVHNLGHGVGYELHEYPSFGKQAGAEGVLAEGDVLTLEPGLYDSAAGYGVRLEDLVRLGSEGPENLTPLPYDLDPRVWLEQGPRG